MIVILLVILALSSTTQINGGLLFETLTCCVYDYWNNPPNAAIAIINGTQNGQSVNGTATFCQNGCGKVVKILVKLFGLSDGLHGISVNEKGNISNGCLNTGGHYNPCKSTHGAPNDQCHHAGDLGNILSTNGVVCTEIAVRGLDLAGPRLIAGKTLVVYANQDDEGKTCHPDSKINGNSGPPVACGIIAKA